METTNEIRHIEVTDETILYFDTARKWSMFLAILGFIAVGFMLIVGASMVAFMPVLDTENELGTWGVALVFGLVILFACIYFFPVLYLFRFSVHTKNAVNSISSTELSNAVKNLKSCFKFMGIFSIAILSLYLIVIIVAVVMAGFSAF